MFLCPFVVKSLLDPMTNFRTIPPSRHGAGGFHRQPPGRSAGRARRAASARLRALQSRGDPGLLRLIPADMLEKVEIIAGIPGWTAIREAETVARSYSIWGRLSLSPTSVSHPAQVAETNLWAP